MNARALCPLHTRFIASFRCALDRKCRYFILPSSTRSVRAGTILSILALQRIFFPVPFFFNYSFCFFPSRFVYNKYKIGCDFCARPFPIVNCCCPFLSPWNVLLISFVTRCLWWRCCCSYIFMYLIFTLNALILGRCVHCNFYR